MATLGQNELRIVVLTPTRKLFDAVADDVSFPSTLGRLQILPGHASLVCQVGTGVLFYNKGNTTSFCSISGGVADVKDNTVTILADRGEDAASIDAARAEKALERAKLRMAGKSLNGVAPSEGALFDLARAADAEARAATRLEAATLHSSKSAK